MNDILAWPAAFYTGTSCLRGKKVINIIMAASSLFCSKLCHFTVGISVLVERFEIEKFEVGFL